jgi:hypothetical protein
LDGLDELSIAARIKVIAKLNEAISDGELGFVLTCRTDEYETTVEASGIVRSCVVIEGLPLNPQVVHTYLESHLPVHLLTAWRPILTSIIDDPGNPLSEALNTPLMLWLVYQVYARTGRSPRELADKGRFPEREYIQAHLFSNLIPALIESYPPDPRLPARPRRAWNSLKAQRWLEHLAWHLNAMNTYNFVWWQLPAAIPKRKFNILLGLPLEASDTGTPFSDEAAMYAQGWTSIFETISGFALACGYGLLIGIVIGIATGFSMGLSTGLAASITTGVVIAFTVGPTLANSFRVRTTEIPVHFDRAFAYDLRNSSSFLRYSRWEFVRRNITVGLVRGLIFGIFFTILEGFRLGLTFGVLAALVAMLSFSIVATMIGTVTGGRMRGVPAWPAYASARIALMIRHRVPWQLMQFLDDFHRLGVIRQAGPVFQFRHATLQDHLAGAYERDSHGR